jgi:hypothetical protein
VNPGILLRASCTYASTSLCSLINFPPVQESSKQEQKRDKKMAIHMLDYVPMQALLYHVFVSGIIYPLVLSLVHK